MGGEELSRVGKVFPLYFNEFKLREGSTPTWLGEEGEAWTMEIGVSTGINSRVYC